MKQMRWLLGLVLLIAVSPQGVDAVIDPTPNSLGVYFDQNADSREVFVGPSMPFFAYVILTNPTYSDVWGFEFGYSIDGADLPNQMFRLQNTLPPNSIDLGNSADFVAGDYVVGLADPLPGSPAVILVQWQFMLLTPTVAGITLSSSTVQSIPDGLPAYEAGGVVVPLVLENNCTLINQDCGLAIEARTFGAVKTLYR